MYQKKVFGFFQSCIDTLVFWFEGSKNIKSELNVFKLKSLEGSLWITLWQINSTKRTKKK